MSVMSVSEARAALPEVLDRVERGEEITLTRHGRPVAVVVRPDVLRTRRGGAAAGIAEELRRALEAGRQVELAQATHLDGARADELVSSIRQARDAGSGEAER